MTQNTHISVKLMPKLRLEGALRKAGVEDPATVTHLTIAGKITDNDINYIRFSMTELRELDMSSTSGVNIIFHECFYNFNLTSIIIPNSIKKIEFSAFGYCSNLTSFFIPILVRKIDSMAFSGCENLTTFTVHHDNPVYSSENGVLFNKDKTKLILFPPGIHGDYIIPDSVTEIGEWAFSFCKGLTSIIIPNSVKKIGYNAFIYTGLTSVNIPESVKIINNAFGNVFFTVDPNNPVYISEKGKLREIAKKQLKRRKI